MEPRLPQATHLFPHGELGSVPIFIVPIGSDPDGLTHEAVFTAVDPAGGETGLGPV